MLWLFGALAILPIAGALCLVLWNARRLRLLHERVLAQEIPQDDPRSDRLFEGAAALYHGTRFEGGGALLLPSWRAPCVGDLWCTAQGLYLRREPGGPEGGRVLGWPMGWIEEVTLVRAFAPLAGKELPALRLRYRRGGSALVSELSLRGGMESLEKLRRELHLRQAQGSALDQLRRFVEAATAFGPGGGSGPGPASLAPGSGTGPKGGAA